jgi:hypothetical protein
MISFPPPENIDIGVSGNATKPMVPLPYAALYASTYKTVVVWPNGKCRIMTVKQSMRDRIQEYIKQ